jgi:hypothetical protein
MAAVAALTATLLLASAVAGSAAAESAVAVPRLATTGDDSELVRALPIATDQYANERVVMSLGPEDLQQLDVGDRLWAGGEVQVSTTCVDRGRRCVGRRYDFNPWITARIVIAAAPSATSPALALSEPVTVHCKQRRPNRNHHCTLVLPNRQTTVADVTSLPCPANACYVNLIAGAWASKARRGNRVVLGGDRPDGSIAQDKGRLNVIVDPPAAVSPSASTSTALVNDSVPVGPDIRETRRVIYSVEIPAGRKGDVLAVDASYFASLDGLRFNAFIGSRVIVAESPASTKPSGIAKKAALLTGHVTETNGFNCTLGRSGYASPCTVVKAGATQLIRNAVDREGEPVPLYVNLVSAVAPKLPETLEPDDVVSVTPAAGLSVLLLPAG